MAKVISFQIPKSQREFVRYQEDRGRHFYDKLHQHPQLQLTVILEGKGQFLSGDYVGRFQVGDLFFLGENVPHVFRSDPEYFEENGKLSTAGNTIFFDFAALGTALGELEDLQALRKFKDFSGLCFQVLGETKSRILEIFDVFPESYGLARFQFAIQLLAILDQAGDSLVPLNRPTLIRGLSERDGKRMDQVMQFLLENRFRQVSLEEASEKANLSKEAFCRFFKLRTRKTFTQYLQLLRINEAQKLLQETDLPVSEIAFKVGFENLSYFNRSFKSILGMPPKAFRK
ncbi:AraC family transcriptional regulator [Algoriphagus lacus]|uniref:AraC family transcriptional regulator n=1 Tax=Algoriphagus lacus TaxID=2056311 RepID=A0A418PWP7_9BACT|nr:AraC family transcriptional regulator [Algoriphagus lacus]RIW18580.1 AraC family transcriptional regulator [Algoriphagus lacus]